jgi:hypothetical protein
VTLFAAATIKHPFHSLVTPDILIFLYCIPDFFSPQLTKNNEKSKAFFFGVEDLIPCAQWGGLKKGPKDALKHFNHSNAVYRLIPSGEKKENSIPALPSKTARKKPTNSQISATLPPLPPSL